MRYQFAEEEVLGVAAGGWGWEGCEEGLEKEVWRGCCCCCSLEGCSERFLQCCREEGRSQFRVAGNRRQRESRVRMFRVEVLDFFQEGFARSPVIPG